MRRPDRKQSNLAQGQCGKETNKRKDQANNSFKIRKDKRNERREEKERRKETKNVC